MAQQRRSKKRKSDYVLAASILAIVLYTVAGIVVQIITGSEISPTLTTAWYSYWTVEIVALAGIKITNVIRGEDNIDVTDNSSRKD
jgi:hypothetical protein